MTRNTPLYHASSDWPWCSTAIEPSSSGARMFLAEKTVKNYVSRLLAKLGMERRTQAAVFASKLDQQSGQSQPPAAPPE